MTDWNALADSLEAATEWLENPELNVSIERKGELENLIGFAQLYVATENPIYAWDAFLWLQEPRLMPEWILCFIQHQGYAIGQLATDKSITPDQALDKLSVKLGLKGNGNAFNKYRKDKWQACRADEVDWLEADGLGQTHARERIGKKIGKSGNTLANYQKKTHENWDAQRKAIDKLKKSKK